MKESINYTYNLNVENLEDFSFYYRFKINGQEFYFVPFNRSEEELKDLIECSRELKIRGIECHDFILNRNNLVVTKVGDQNFLLLRVIGEAKKEFYISDIVDLNNKLVLTSNKSKLYRNNWVQLWSEKVDYFEYQIRELGKEKIGVLNSFSYYIGLAENAICYVNKTNASLTPSDLDRVTLSHRRFFYPNIKLNYLNPLSFIFDLEVRDVAEYVKILYFYGEEGEAFAELELFFKLRRLSSYGYQMLFARLLYPSYYFDVYEKVMSNECSEDQLIPIVTKVDKYEEFLSSVLGLVSKYAVIEPIDWINKKRVIS